MSAIFQDEIIYGAVAPSPINDGSTSTSEVWSGDYLSTKFSEVNSKLDTKQSTMSFVSGLAISKNFIFASNKTVNIVFGTDSDSNSLQLARWGTTKIASVPSEYAPRQIIVQPIRVKLGNTFYSVLLEIATNGDIRIRDVEGVTTDVIKVLYFNITYIN